MHILAIDPGPEQSAWISWSGNGINGFDKEYNWSVQEIIAHSCADIVVFEQVMSYGMSVGKDVFETVFWTGRMVAACEYHNLKWARMPRMDVKLNLCKQARAKDVNIITALIDRFDPDRKFGKYGKGTKANPGMFFGFSSDIWQAFALAVTYYDINSAELSEKQRERYLV